MYGLAQAASFVQLVVDHRLVKVVSLEANTINFCIRLPLSVYLE